MRKRKTWIIMTSCILAVAILAAVVGWIVLGNRDIVDRSSVDQSNEGVQAALSAEYWISLAESDIIASCGAEAFLVTGDRQETVDGAAYIPAGERVTVPLEIPQTGEYALVLVYQTVGNMIVQSSVTVTAGDTMVTSYINGIWCDESKYYDQDRYHNEITPSQVKVDTFVKDYVRDSSTLNFEPVAFSLEKGKCDISIYNSDQDILLQAVILTVVPTTVDYTEYAAGFDGNAKADMIVIEGEDYLAKSDSYIRTKTDANSSCEPYSPYQKLLNSVDYFSWKTAGQRVMWKFQVEEAGWYQLCFHYSQPDKEGQSVYRSIEIDGKTPFTQLNEVAFPYTGNTYDNLIVEVNGEAAKIYLTEGKHTLSMLTSVPSMAQIVEEINAISEELSDIGLDLQHVAGSNADVNRTWDIETYIPGVISHLEELRQRLLDVYDTLCNMSGTAASSCANLKQAAGIITQALKRPDKLPTYLESLSVGSGSAVEMLAQLVNSINAQGISLDRIYLYGDDSDLPSGHTGLVKSAWASFQRFIYSLFNREGAFGVSDDGKEDENAIQVWVNRPISYVETLQVMADSMFTPETGITVYFSVMPDEGKLLLANASDTCPDVALGVSGDRPYQLGARGAALDLTEFDDLADFVAENFETYDLEPFVYDGAIYGIPETKNFYVLMYRTDIMEKLELSVPDTWEDVAAMMPVLRQSGMTFYMPLSSATGTKPLSSVAPFLLQYGAQLYSDDGMSTELNNEAGIAAFKTLTNLYTLYGVQNNAPSFYNNFRYGTMPIGVASFQNYVEMLYAAPEIAGKWKIAPAPGTMQADGTINRQQVSVDRSALIMKSTEKKDQSWKFLKWWMSEETQIEFAYTLQTKYGSEYVWNTANKTAFTQLSFPKSDRDVILEQWEDSTNYRNMPATYMLERELSNAWYRVVDENISPRTALNDAVYTINQETTIRMQQFGYLDEDGNVIREYDMRTAEEILNEVRNR